MRAVGANSAPIRGEALGRYVALVCPRLWLCVTRRFIGLIAGCADSALSHRHTQCCPRQQMMSFLLIPSGLR